MSEMSKEQMAAMIAQLQGKIVELETKKTKNIKPKAGRMIYINKEARVPVKTRQVLALAAIFRASPKLAMTEAEAFALVIEGHKNGTLVTDQDPVHIYRYYRDPLLCSGLITQEG